MNMPGADDPADIKRIEESLHAQLNKRYQRENRIFSVLVEVTHRCVSRCIHCFLLKNRRDELEPDEIEDVFDQLAKEGTIELALSGGEPFLRDDFPEILAKASRHRFFVTILTTGILIQKPEVTLLERNRIKKIELSLLGSRPETHDAIMNHEGAFNRLKRAVKLLKHADFMIALKATIMRQNVREIEEMRNLAEEWGVRFSASLSLTPRENGDRTPQSFGLDADVIETLDPSLLDFAPLHSGESLKKPQLTCRAGSTVAGISPAGDIFPCILMRKKVGNIRQQSLEEIWHTHPSPFLREIRALKETDIAECYRCERVAICPRCSGTAYMETGSLIMPSPSACIYSKGIKKALLRREGKNDV
ncbi:MAG: radical SAM protein [Spirochaetales bacterium]|nr:radical SAM protein [Spirochaetales bacterium]